MKYIDERPDSQWGFIKTDEFKITDGEDKRLFVVDNFYEDPLAVRDYALSQYFFDDEGYLGMRTRKQFFFDGVKERFEKIINKKIMFKKKVRKIKYSSRIVYYYALVASPCEIHGVPSKGSTCSRKPHITGGGGVDDRSSCV